MNPPHPYQLFEDLKKLRDSDSEITLTLNASTAWILISQLQIAQTHPSNTGEIASEVCEIAKQIQAVLAECPLH